MTLSELLHKVTFEELVPFMSLFEDHDWNLASYKMHYDYLWYLSEESNNRRTTSLISRKEKHHSLLESHSIKINKWRMSLVEKLNTEAIVNGTLAETAANYLWNILFQYGFSEYQNAELEHLFRCTLVQNTCYYRNMYPQYIPSKKEMLAIKSFRQTIRQVMKEHRLFRTWKEEDEIYPSHNKKHGWRYWKRREINQEYNKRINTVGTFIEDLQNRGQNIIVPPELDYLSILFKANHCLIKRWQSYAYDATKRYDYFRELIEKYNLLFWIRDSNCILCISASTDYPLTVEEMNLLCLIAGNRNGEKSFCVKTDDSLGKEIRIDAAFYTI